MAPGKVVSVGQLGTYGLTVIIDHGGGDYSIYGSLSRADVVQQQKVAKGQVIGGVGMSDPDLPAAPAFRDPSWRRGRPHAGGGSGDVAARAALTLRGQSVAFAARG